MRKYISLMLTAALVTALSACSSYNYYTAAANKTNLSQYRTFGWAPLKKNPNKQWRPLDEIGNGTLQQAAKGSLQQKGLAFSENNPDLLVAYATVTGRGSKTEFYSPYAYGGWGYPFGWGYGFYRPWAYGYGYGPYYGPTVAQRVHYKEGTVIIDLIDPKTNTIVWRGYGVGELHNPKQTLKELPKVVDGIIKQLDLSVPANRS